MIDRLDEKYEYYRSLMARQNVAAKRLIPLTDEERARGCIDYSIPLPTLTKEHFNNICETFSPLLEFAAWNAENGHIESVLYRFGEETNNIKTIDLTEDIIYHTTQEILNAYENYVGFSTFHLSC